MLYNIEGKKVNIIVKNEKFELSENIKEKMLENFKSMKQKGLNIWNGEIFCVSSMDIKKREINLVCKMSDYAHYLYEQKVGCPKEYKCMALSAGCLIETIDGYYVIGEQDETTSHPNMLQTVGGGIDKKDISQNIINVEQTILRETLEEVNINLNDKDIVICNYLKYIFISGKNEKPRIKIFSKVKIKMTAKQMEEYFNKYNEYLRTNNLEVEFKKIYLLKKEKAILELENLNKPKRPYLEAILLDDIK